MTKESLCQQQQSQKTKKNQYKKVFNEIEAAVLEITKNSSAEVLQEQLKVIRQNCNLEIQTEKKAA